VHHVQTYPFVVQLLSGNMDRVVWESGERLFDCIDADIPILLGVGDFLHAFRIVVDYPKRLVRVEWDS